LSTITGIEQAGCTICCRTIVVSRPQLGDAAVQSYAHRKNANFWRPFLGKQTSLRVNRGKKGIICRLEHDQ